VRSGAHVPAVATSFTTNTPGDAKTARLTALRAAAAFDDAVAQTELASLYLDGNGVAADPALAARLLEEAAVQGHTEAQYRLARLYEDGRGRGKDASLALFWYDSAATHGSIPAAARLGTLYAEGHGVAQDYPRAADWFRRAAITGDARSQFALGYLYENGLGVPASADEAHRWWGESASLGNDDAQARLDGRPAPPPFASSSRPRENADAAVQDLSSGEIAEIQRLLKLLAFEPGATDGRVTPETRDAIRIYQGIAGLTADGQPNASVLASLRAVAGAPH
jgi:TPR repeat protein